MNLYLMATAALLGYLVLAWILGTVAGLAGTEFYIFFTILAILGISAAGFFVWFRRRAQKQDAPDSGDGGSNEIDVLIREAESRLAASRLAEGATLGNLPAVFVLGEPGTVKTTTIVHSGLEAELLAGQVHQDSSIAPTKTANVWIARRVAFVEAAGSLTSEPAGWVRLVRRLKPLQWKSVLGRGGEAPRAALVCVDLEALAAANASGGLGSLTRKLQSRLGEISQQLGISFPVYVLFTKCDRLPFFADYVRTLSNEESQQVLGATLPVSLTGGGGVYAEEESRRLSAAFEEIFTSLADKRIEVLGREQDPERLPGSYEFPREFQKLRPAVVQFLVEVFRPSQLRANPFLRGFYFSGVRPVFIQDAAPAAAPRQAQQEEGFGGATRVFRVGGPAGTGRPMEQPRGASVRKVPQWMFLTKLFHNIILEDRAAMGASSASTKTGLLRRLLLASATLLCLIFSVGFLVSFLGNRSLEREAMEAARALPATEAAGSAIPALDSLQRLETLRQSLEKLARYERDGAPMSLRWGLYAGADILPNVRRLYYDRFRRLLFGETQDRLHKTLQGLPASPGPGEDYGRSYDTLKAYLITTSNHDKSTAAFLSPVLLDRWSAGRQVDAPRLALAQKQFAFYGDDLKTANPYSSDSDGAAVERARRYLSQFSGTERIYQFMLSEASSKYPPINFNRKFPGSSEAVINNRDVPGAFSKEGWAFLQGAIKKADQYFGGERWVLGDHAAASLDRTKLEQELQERYTQDFIARWREYLKNSSVVRYANLKDASAKLTLLSGNQTPLLALLWLASQNTGVDSPKVAEAMQPVHQVVPPASVDRYVGPTNQPYMNALLALQTAVDQAAQQQPAPDPSTVSQTLASATGARLTARQMAQGFRIDREAHVEAMVQKLMEDPITHAEALLKSLGPAELNAGARSLCTQFTPLTAKFPFQPSAAAEVTLAELGAVLRPNDGALWKFYEDKLKPHLQRQGTEYVPNPSGGLALNPAFVRFFNDLARFSEALYPQGSAEPRLGYSLAPVRSEQIETMSLTLDGQSATFKGQDPPKQFVWPGAASRGVRLTAKVSGGSDFEFQSREGLWAVFRFFADANRLAPAAGGGYSLEWVVTQGRELRPVMVGGRPLKYQFLLNTGGAPPVFHKEFLAGLKCVSQAAR